MSIIVKYLNKYAVPEAQKVSALAKNIPQHIQHCLVIPAYDESEAFIKRITQHSAMKEALVVIVINQPVSVTQCANNTLMQLLTSSADVIAQSENIYLSSLDGVHFLVIDRYSLAHRLDDKKGVGLARKIGADIVCALQQSKVVPSFVIYSSDADAHLPDNYFQTLDWSEKDAAKIFDFHHHSDDADAALIDATDTYEAAIKYYRDGLYWAGSPYAFYTLGSTLCFSTYHYCAVRGFPERPAGEDFYLLNKLAKVGNVHYEPEICIRLEPRQSHRVPFGTGPAVSKIIALQSEAKAYYYYNPKVFEALKETLECVLTNIALVVVEKKAQPLDTESLLQQSLPEYARDAMQALDFEHFCNHAQKQCAAIASFKKQFHDWFDAFRTLKFIHYLEQHYFPAVPLETCLKLTTHWKI